jgi:erythronate-4-phosphate dehydrogenase
MRIVADENIPFAREAFSPFGDVTLVNGRSITSDDLRDADILLVRSVTRVDRALLEGSPVGFVGTATIGVDHIDTGYLEHAGIVFADAAGSNSLSVAEYVVAALLELRARGLTALEGVPLGIVGMGRIGTLVADMARTLGMHPVGYDPPRKLADGFASATLEELTDCPVLTLHLPMVRSGDHPTFHLADRSFLERLPARAIVINTSRGGVIDSIALSDWLAGATEGGAVLDVWEGEPDLPIGLISSTAIATPHIAGYSLDGKIRGTAMLAEALARLHPAVSYWDAGDAIPAEAGAITISSGRNGLDAATDAVRAAYDIRRDDADLRRLLWLDAEAARRGFDRLRREYGVRREFPAWHVAGATGSSAALLEKLGFRVNTGV